MTTEIDMKWTRRNLFVVSVLMFPFWPFYAIGTLFVEWKDRKLTEIFNSEMMK